MKRYFTLFCVVFLLPVVALFSSDGVYWAFVGVPVADMLGKDPTRDTDSRSAERVYENLPYSLAGKYGSLRVRVHQLLFNQRVCVVKECSGEAYVEVPSVVCQSSAKGCASPLRGWVLQKNLVPFSALGKNGDELYKIPKCSESQVVFSVTHPYYVKQCDTVFSAGTQFVLSKKKKNTYVGYVYDAKKGKCVKASFPKKICFISANRSRSQRIKDFISLLKVWANRGSTFIPYVLGGNSWVSALHTDSVYSHRPPNMGVVLTSSNTYHAYNREDSDSTVKSGFDCSTLIYAAAQVVGLPYYGKNTTTLTHQLRRLKNGDSIEVGDIIWLPGHVMVISKVRGGLRLIQAEGYSSRRRAGKVYECAASKIFSDIATTQDLLVHYHYRTPLVCLNKKGKKLSPIGNWAVYKLKSCWETR